MIAPARLAAYDVLRAVSTGRADLPAALARARMPLHDERDRALAGEIATGTLRWQGAFDLLISTYARRPLSSLDGEVVDILRLTLFQLLHLDRVPASAAVNDAVQMTKRAGKSSAAPFVNALLRRASRERGHLPLPPRALGDRAAEVDYLVGALSHPRWLVERWHGRYGFEASETWCRFDNEAAPLTIRANRLRTSRAALAELLREAGVHTRETAFAPDGLVVTRGNPLLSPLASQGLFAVQDEASQIVGEVVRARQGERILDACAAPGGKTTAMAASMNNAGLIVSADVRAKRVRLLAETVAAAGATSVRVVQANAAQPLPFTPEFDCVLVDAPCTGLGTLRRDPDIKWRRTGDDFDEVTSLQLRILINVAEVVRPGGRIVYATCSSEPDENEQVVERFLEAQSAFRAEPLYFGPAPQLINSSGHLQTLPFRDGLEGFFAAAVARQP